jgi:hypothetical protein
VSGHLDGTDDGSGYGVRGESFAANTIGVVGESSDGIGVQGQSANNSGVFGASATGTGVFGSGGGVGVSGRRGNTDPPVLLLGGVVGFSTDTHGVSGLSIAQGGILAGVFGQNGTGSGVVRHLTRPDLVRYHLRIPLRPAWLWPP